jgi:hypothetical protein
MLPSMLRTTVSPSPLKKHLTDPPDSPQSGSAPDELRSKAVIRKGRLKGIVRAELF